MNKVLIEKFAEEDLPEMIKVWNSVVEEGQAFPQEDLLTIKSAKKFFASQSLTAVARTDHGDPVIGLYILHPNNIGRCGHICNASYAVSANARGQGIGRALVQDSLKQAASLGFKIMQFNAVAADNEAARRLYEDLDFQPLGIIPEGFRNREGKYKDICLYWRKV